MDIRDNKSGDVLELADELSLENEKKISGEYFDIVFAHELSEDFVPPDELLQGVFVIGDSSVIYGDSNSGKTFFIIDIACAIARGISWMNRKTEPGLIIYLAAESPSSVKRRLQAYQKKHNVRVPNFAIVQNPIDLFSSDSDADTLVRTIQALEEKCGQKARLIVGDTLARLSAGANENAGQDMGVVIRHIDAVRMHTSAHFTLIHHIGKNAAAGQRGWSGVRAAIDTEIEITDSLDGRCAEITKQRDLDTKGERIGFRLEPVTLGLTKWGSLATSCIVLPVDAPPQSKGKRPSLAAAVIEEYMNNIDKSVSKSLCVLHFENRFAHTTIYRELVRLVKEGRCTSSRGIITKVDGKWN